MDSQISQFFAHYGVYLFLALISMGILAYLFSVRYVRKHSVIFQNILSLNNQYSAIFHFSIRPQYTYSCRKKSKAAFDRTNYHQLLNDYLAIKKQEIRTAISYAESNAKQFVTYQTRYATICSYPSPFRLFLFQVIERHLCKKARLNPVTSVDLLIVSSYTSPKGKNHYQNSMVFSQHDILRALQDISFREQFQQSKEYQRKSMTDSLRYDIMKRDGFRCQLCGASARDGAKLHVDHIVPVSKGGKTTKDNLRTLCSHCNLGKSNKYDSNGVN